MDTTTENVVELFPPVENLRCGCGEEWINTAVVVSTRGDVVARLITGVCASCGTPRDIGK